MKNKRNKAFALPETVAALAVVLIVTLLAVTFLSLGAVWVRKNSAEGDLVQNERRLGDALRDFIASLDDASAARFTLEDGASTLRAGDCRARLQNENLILDLPGGRQVDLPVPGAAELRFALQSKSDGRQLITLTAIFYTDAAHAQRAECSFIFAVRAAKGGSV